MAAVVAAVPVSVVAQRVLTDKNNLDPLLSGPAPPFSLPATDGTVVSLEGLAGRRVIVHFFGSWCKACRQEALPLTQTRDLHPEVAIVGVLFRDDPAAATAVAAELGIDWPLLVDEGERTAAAYGVDSAPITFFISSAGEISGRLIGPVSRPLVDRQLARLD